MEMICCYFMVNWLNVPSIVIFNRFIIPSRKKPWKCFMFLHFLFHWARNNHNWNLFFFFFNGPQSFLNIVLYQMINISLHAVMQITKTVGKSHMHDKINNKKCFLGFGSTLFLFVCCRILWFLFQHRKVSRIISDYR